MVTVPNNTRGRWDFGKSMGSHKGQESPADMEQNASTLWLRVYCKPFFYTDGARTLNDLGSLSVRYGPDIKEYWVADLSDPDSRLTKEWARLDLHTSENGLSGAAGFSVSVLRSSASALSSKQIHVRWP